VLLANTYNICFELSRSNVMGGNIKNSGVSQALKNEVERLKQISGRHRRSRSMASCSDMVSPGQPDWGPHGNSLAMNWQMLDMSKLSLGGSSVPVPPTRHSSGGF
jgi:hypothetical protein